MNNCRLVRYIAVVKTRLNIQLFFKGEHGMHAAPHGNNPVRSSQRINNIPNPNRLPVIYVEGHGEFRAPYGTFLVPDSIEIVIYQGPDVGLDDSHGIAIASGVGVPARLPTAWDAINNEYDTEPVAAGGAVRQNTGGTRVYRGGENCPDYTLISPQEPGMAVLVVQPGSVVAPIGVPIQLSLVVANNPSSQIHWVCCTVRR